MATGHQDLRFQKGQETATLRTHSEDDGSFRLDLPTGSVHARAVEGEAGMSLRVDGVSHRLRVIRHGAERTVIFAGQNYTLYQVDPLRAETAGEDKLIAPIPARVSRVLVEPGAAVKKRTPLLVLEAMKMELTLSAPTDGTVESVRHAVGEMVEEVQSLSPSCAEGRTQQD